MVPDVAEVKGTVIMIRDVPENMDVMCGRGRPVGFHLDASKATFRHIVNEDDVTGTVIDLDAV